MTRRLLALFAPGLLMLAGCSDSPSRYHNHGTPGDGNGHLKVKPRSFGTMDITPDGTGSEWTILRQTDGRTRLLKKQGKSLAELKPLPPPPNPEYDPQTGGFPKESNIRFEHTPPSQAFPRSNPRPRNGECPVCGTIAQPYHEGSGSTQDAYYPWPGSRRLTICSHCNTTFRQWAEGKEPKR